MEANPRTGHHSGCGVEISWNWEIFITKNIFFKVIGKNVRKMKVVTYFLESDIYWERWHSFENEKKVLIKNFLVFGTFLKIQ